MISLWTRSTWSDRSTISTLVVVVAVTLLLLLPLPVFLDNCANGATDEVVVCGAAAEDASAGSIVLGILHIRASVVLTTLRLVARIAHFCFNFWRYCSSTR